MTKKTAGTFAIHCPQCGSDQFIHPEGANLESEITCASCGLKAIARDLATPQGMEHAKRLALEALRTSLRK